MDVSENSGYSTPKSSHFNRRFHYFHHPFLGFFSSHFFGNTQIKWGTLEITAATGLHLVSNDYPISRASRNASADLVVVLEGGKKLQLCVRFFK